MATFGAKAQNEQTLVFSNENPKAGQPIQDVRIDKNSMSNLPHRYSGSAGKGTGVSGSRWYEHFGAVDQLTSSGIQNNRILVPIWFDSTIRQRFSDGSGGSVLGRINFSSLSQHFDPIHFQAFNSSNFGYAGNIIIGSNTPYKVDSVSFTGAYIRIKNKPTVVDTLIIAVAPGNGAYIYTKTQASWVSNYNVPAGKDTLYGYSPLATDSVNRTILSDVTGTPAKVWKVALTAADGDTVTAAGTVAVKPFTFKVPDGLNVPAGNGFNVSVTFKSGDIWVPNVDTVNGMNRFTLLSSEASSGQYMPYYYYDYSDRNMSGAMFSVRPTFYRPAIAIEGTNQPSYQMEFHWISAFVACQDCEVVSVKDRTGIIAEVGKPYPSPATEHVVVPFMLKEAAQVTVTLTNAVGQVVKTQAIGKVEANQSTKATFSTAGLSAGVYFATVEAEGQRLSNRFVVIR